MTKLTTIAFFACACCLIFACAWFGEGSTGGMPADKRAREEIGLASRSGPENSEIPGIHAVTGNGVRQGTGEERPDQLVDCSADHRRKTAPAETPFSAAKTHPTVSSGGKSSEDRAKNVAGRLSGVVAGPRETGVHRLEGTAPVAKAAFFPGYSALPPHDHGPSGSVGLGPGSNEVDIAMEVPAGEIVPLVLVPVSEGDGLTPKDLAIINTEADRFAVEASRGGTVSRPDAVRWRSAQQQADELFRTWYGQDAYMAMEARRYFEPH